MNELEVFQHESFGKVRTLMVDAAPWFLAADVCMALDIQNVTQAIARLEEDERSIFNIGRQGNTNFVNEPGLYTLVLGSRKPEAKVFKRWITHEVIPDIRRTGSYSNKAAKPALTASDYLKAAQIVSRCTDKRLPVVLSMLEAGGIHIEVEATEKPTEKKALPQPTKETRRSSEMRGISRERDAFVALWNSPLPLRETASLTGIPNNVLHEYWFAKKIPTQQHIEIILREVAKGMYE